MFNAVVDVYRGFRADRPYPGGADLPALRNVRGYLREAVGRGRLGQGLYLRWTTLLDVPLGTDLRSAYNTQINSWEPEDADTIVLADYPIPGWCTAFLVVQVQRINRGTINDCLRVYLDRLQPRQGPCFQGCCRDPLPALLYATIPFGSGCLCLDEVVVPLLYLSSSDAWIGSVQVCADEALRLTFQCGTSSCNGATLSVDFENHGSVGPVLAEPDCSCLPLSVRFLNIEFPDPGDECVGPIAVTITF